MTRLAILATTAALATAAQAQDQDSFVLPEITLTAFQTPAEIGQTGATVDIVTRADLQAAGTTRVVDYLTTLPGISASSNGGFGTQTTLRMRGLPGQYVKVLVDGIDVTDPSGTQISFDPGALMIDDIDRIEVLKGPQSALYGSEAIGGVIAITTRRPDENGVRQAATVEYGSNASAKGSYSLTGRGDDYDFALTATRLKTDGFSAADEDNGNSEDDGAEASRVSASGSYQLGPDLRVGAAAFWQKTRADFDESFPAVADGIAPYVEVSRSKSRGARVFADYTIAGVNNHVSAQRYVIDRELTQDFGDYVTRGERTELTYKGDMQVHDQVTLAWGGTHSQETLDQGAVEADFIINSAFAEARLAATPDLDIALSGRHDHHSAFGSENTGRLALAWRVTDDWLLRAQIGTGFRAPSPYELYTPFYGNPDLKPETSRGIEFGAERKFANDGFVRATVFQSRITDLIDYDFTTSSYAQVAGDSRTRGVELSAAAPLTDRIRISGNFTYTDSEGPDGMPLNRVPARALNLRLEGDAGPSARYMLGLSHVSGLTDRGQDMPTYTVVNAAVEYDFSTSATGYLRIENLLDEEYQVVRGYGTSDRAVYAGIRASF
ncbi:TonB-dependent receptor plug domain-containing protein [Paracoccus homiensis]|uniref:Vitamin B12 transporter n=1 Tax=Paracoccus homiensis TaxID=364199 RepID=A0A1H9Y6N0_9RHOB|nr:TonB-dependent receptor [Paracoccus homiensis]SES64480.1 vitamin B12 transporter [Paracoccus homiensis]